MISDWWEGLDEFFEREREILIAEDGQDVIAALRRPEGERREIARAARARVLREHTAAHRATELEELLENARAHQRVEV